MKASKPVKRPSGQSPALPIFDSIGQCSGATGIPVSVLRAAKRDGCLAFVGSRVDLQPLLKWIFSREDDAEGGDWDRRYKRARAMREENRLAEDQQRLLPKEQVSDITARACAGLFTELDRVFCGQFPAEAKGLDELGIKAAGERAIEQVKTAMREKLATIIPA